MNTFGLVQRVACAGTPTFFSAQVVLRKPGGRAPPALEPHQQPMIATLGFCPANGCGFRDWPANTPVDSQFLFVSNARESRN